MNIAIFANVLRVFLGVLGVNLYFNAEIAEKDAETRVSKIEPFISWTLGTEHEF